MGRLPTGPGAPATRDGPYARAPARTPDPHHRHEVEAKAPTPRGGGSRTTRPPPSGKKNACAPTHKGPTASPARQRFDGVRGGLWTVRAVLELDQQAFSPRGALLVGTRPQRGGGGCSSAAKQSPFTVHLVSFVCLRAWTGPAGKGAGFGSTKGGGGVHPPLRRGVGVPPPLQPPKLSNTPRGHTLAGGRPRGSAPVSRREGGRDLGPCPCVRPCVNPTQTPALAHTHAEAAADAPARPCGAPSPAQRMDGSHGGVGVYVTWRTGQ